MIPTDRQTGYPSVDKPWLKYYEEDAEYRANNIPLDKTVWDVIEEKLKQNIEIPAIEYFGRVISRQEFIDNVYLWARAFKALGIKEDEIIPYYGPFLPDVGAMAFALNIIGACPYFLKLAMSKEALSEETKDARFAIVFDDMWGNVNEEFSKERFQKIIIVSSTDAMPSPLKQLVKLLNKSKHSEIKKLISKNGKFINLDKAKQYSELQNGELRADFVSDRAAFITSSSGTTVNGVVKGCVATNESTISQLYMGDASGVPFFPGDRCLDHFPPTASTALNILFFLPLYRGMTIVMDPRVSEKDFYRQVVTSKASVIVNTGSAWESFFERFEKEVKRGKKFSFPYSKGWVIGGEGTDISKYRKWKKLLLEASSPVGIASAYGLSEVFSAACTEMPSARSDENRELLSVGIPYAGITVGVFDKEGKELSYNQRGELWIKSKSAMKEYYNKPELTAQVKVDGWIHTGDLAEIDENGFVYLWGRVKDSVTLKSDKEVYLFDLAFLMKQKPYIYDAMVLQMQNSTKEVNVVAHIVWNQTVQESDKAKHMVELNTVANDFDPDIILYAFAFHDRMLPYSPTTLKKDKNKMSKQMEGLYQVVDGKIQEMIF